MRILVVGASKGAGALAVKAALAYGHHITAFARSADRLGLNDARLTKVTGDFHVAADVDRVVPGHDAVIITASASSSRTSNRTPPSFRAARRR